MDREKIEQGTILKLAIFARVLASQGAYGRSLLILNNIKTPVENIHKATDGMLLFKSIYYVYLFNNDFEKSLEALENYLSFVGEDKEKMIFYLSSRFFVYFSIKNIKSAKLNLEELSTLVKSLGSQLQKDFTRLLQFGFRTMEGVLDEEGYAYSISIYKYTIGERHKLFIKGFQLQYLILLGDKIKVLEHIERIYQVNRVDGTSSKFINKIIKNELQDFKYQEIQISNFRLQLNVLRGSKEKHLCIEFTNVTMHPVNYLSSPFNNNQLDLLAGVITTSDETFFLTELQRKCLYHLLIRGETGVSWLLLSELMYGVDLNIDSSFENVRKIVAKLRSMNINIAYKMGLYFFQNTFDSILFSTEFMIGDQLLYVHRCVGKERLSADDISKILGLKKSRTNEFLRKWVEQNRLEIIATKGNQKIYQICL
ncbi:MAG: hypothetical protein H7281_06910 [Bacteriovorax sp.]|nr:hypothetical protein [Bacteriovorax sp.]